ncbi:alpha-lytic protease prodomain-containing protein [Dactylosporangium aurantiacum]|uniref:Alpha-lytic protease prodomain-containing protein n=1 Tax=Dactylosporangium aurantiacum TaxID=35754 RepID=A0A9Q9IF34_9ACTN|nr:alpha-lytic protease prodomain-containing protein [Dactylosporangium aurantiacum]MDG6107076.1 alpha-lytic protease prodomain-containing protein [Dactylosporangium aurantiacum]UWZ51375.1 alpha-lytic protease prodomain-containing protein [Dactylosporangium aurantiacum]
MRSLSKQLLVAAVIGAVGAAVAAVPAEAAPPALVVDQARADELVSVAGTDQATFGGVSVDAARGTLTVRYAPGRLTAARARVGSVATARQGGPGLRVALVPVRHSLAELDAVRRRVAADPDRWQVGGAALAEWYVDVTGNRVAVGVTRLSPQLVAAARAEFGDQVALHEAARATRASRTADWRPWAAGIRIAAGGIACTAGFFVEVPGTPASRKMVTSGHCFANGAVVTNNGVSIGTVSGRTVANNGKDLEYVTGTFTPWTYKGPSSSDYGDFIRGTKASVVGQAFCTNGAFGGEVCAGTVDATNLCVLMTDGVTTCSLDRLVSNGPVITRLGDSGGNVFTYDAAGLKIGGMIVAMSAAGTTTYFHPAAAVVPMGWRVSVG